MASFFASPIKMNVFPLLLPTPSHHAEKETKILAYCFQRQLILQSVWSLNGEKVMIFHTQKSEKINEIKIKNPEINFVSICSELQVIVITYSNKICFYSLDGIYLKSFPIQ